MLSFTCIFYCCIINLTIFIQLIAKGVDDMKNNFKFMYLILFILLLIVVCLALFRYTNKVSEVKEVETDIVKLEELKIKDLDNNDKKIFNKKNDVIIFLDEKCRACIELLPFLKNLNSILKDTDIQVSIVWKNSVNKEKLNKYELPENINYVSNNIDKLSTPYFAIVDTDLSIVYQNNNIEKVLKKTLESLSEKDKKISQNNTISLLLMNNSNKNNSNKELIYFNMKGCPDCKKASKTIKDKKLSNSYNISTINYWEEGSKDTNLDYFNLYANLFDIEWYPSFILISKDLSYELITADDLNNL